MLRINLLSDDTLIMKKLIAFLVLFIFSQTLSAVETDTYFRADYGLGQFKSDKLDALNANPSGSTFGLGFGTRINYIELGFFYRNFSFESDINHDSTPNKVSHKGKSYGVDMSVFLNKRFSLKVGFAIHNYKDTLATPTSAATNTIIKSLYGLEDKYNSTNFYYGANLDLFAGKKYDVFTAITQYPMGDGKSTTSAQVGIRIYMDTTFSSLFGSR